MVTITRERSGWSLEDVLAALGVSRSVYFAWRARAKHDRLEDLRIRFAEPCGRSVARRSGSARDVLDVSPPLAARSPRSYRAVRLGP